MVAATVGIIIYRVVSRVDIFDSKGSIGPTLASVTSSFLNTVCIMVMGKVRNVIIVKRGSLCPKATSELEQCYLQFFPERGYRG